MKAEKVWATRKIARRIAHVRMRNAGVVHPNRPRYTVRSGMIAKLPSYFADNWRRAAK